ncbi:MAG: prefoldin subunit [Candidatus Thorarchaeota archaeon]|jgi:prefoldin beta subunit
MAQQIPPEIEHEIMKLENMRRQFEQLMAAIQTRQSLRESEVTLDELKKHPDDTVTYKSVGQIMFQVDKAQLQEELTSRVGDLKIWLEAKTKGAEKDRKEIEELTKKIQLDISTRNLKVQ